MGFIEKIVRRLTNVPEDEGPVPAPAGYKWVVGPSNYDPRSSMKLTMMPLPDSTGRKRSTEFYIADPIGLREASKHLVKVYMQDQMSEARQREIRRLVEDSQ